MCSCLPLKSVKCQTNTLAPDPPLMTFPGEKSGLWFYVSINTLRERSLIYGSGQTKGNLWWMKCKGQVTLHKNFNTGKWRKLTLFYGWLPAIQKKSWILGANSVPLLWELWSQTPNLPVLDTPVRQHNCVCSAVKKSFISNVARVGHWAQLTIFEHWIQEDEMDGFVLCVPNVRILE